MALDQEQVRDGKTLAMMKLKLVILLCFYTGVVWCQVLPNAAMSGKDSLAKFEGLKKQPPSAELQDVLFATNEDCELFVDDQFKGVVSKSEYRYVKLSA